MGIFDFFTEHVAVDAGTDHLRIVWKDKIVFNEPSRIALDKISAKVVGIGKQTKESSAHYLIKPVNYVIADFHAFEMLLREAVKRSIDPDGYIPKTLISLFSIPTNASEIEKRAYRDSAEHANSKEVFMIHQGCSIAAGLNILIEKKNFIVIDFSASKFQIDIFIDGLFASVGAVRLGTNKIVELVQHHLRRNYQIEISESDTLFMLNDFHRHYKSEQIRIQNVIVATEGLHAVMQNYFAFVNDSIETTLEEVKSEPRMKQVLSNGIYFSGGGSLVEYFLSQIRLPEGVPVHLSRTPLTDTVNGLLKVMADKNKYKEYLLV